MINVVDLQMEVTAAKNLKDGDHIVLDDSIHTVKEFVEWSKPACSGSIWFGAHGHLKVYRTEREKAFRKWKPLRGWFKWLRHFDYHDSCPEDDEVRWFTIGENTPIVKVLGIDKVGEAIRKEFLSYT